MQQEIVGQVILDNKTQPICILGNATITVLGIINKAVPQITCLVEHP